MSKDRVLTDGKLPDRRCPHCKGQVIKMMRHGQLSYLCEVPSCGNWGPWNEATTQSAKA